MKILYISDFFTRLSVFQSQVHTLCNYHAEKNITHLLALGNPHEILFGQVKGNRYALHVYPKFPNPFIPERNRLTARLNLTLGTKKLFYSADIIHARGHVGAAYAINSLQMLNIRKPVIADIRGAIVDELKMTKQKRAEFYSRMASVIERIIFAESDYFFFVSRRMQQYFSEKYSIPPDKSSVFPTIVDEKHFRPSDSDRITLRKQLGINDKFVYVYVGSVEPWQNVDKILLRFNQQVQKDNSLFLLLIVNSPEAVTQLMRQLHIDSKNIPILSLPYSQVGKYLNACDAGLIIRDDSVINQVASPTKINEYLACNLRIIDNLELLGNKAADCADKYDYMPLKQIIEGQQKIYHQLLTRAVS